MIFRRIQPQDIDGVQALAIEGMRPDMYPGHLVPAKVRAVVEHFTKSVNDFNLVAFDPDPVGAIAAVSQPSMWMERNEALVVMCFAKVPNIGRTLIDALMAWVDESFLVRSVIWPQEMGARKGMVRLLSRYGFKTQAMCVYRKD